MPDKKQCPKVLEVCVDSTASALAAKRSGADRLELCADLIIGGTTPSLALLRQVKAETGLPVRALLRPRFGDFHYDPWELAQMEELAFALVQAGANGIVTGVLTPEGALDLPAMERICTAARKAAGPAGVDLALHRAFDVCRDPREALEAACALGMKTILTSGQAPDVLSGQATLSDLVKLADGRIEILAGSGVTPGAIPVLAQKAGVRSFHLSGKERRASQMIFRRENVPMGLPGFDEYELWQTSEEVIRSARQALDQV